MDIHADYSVRMAVPIPSKDQHLVVAARSGCRTAFNELWNLYSRRIYRTLLGITHNAHDAEDALQDAFLRAFLAIESFEGRSSFYSWLTRIAINSALGNLRRRRSRPEASLDQGLQHQGEDAPREFRDLAPNPEQTYAAREERENLILAMRKLPSELRKAIQTRVAEDCSLREVACRLNISEAAAKSRLYRARIMLGSMTAVRYETNSQVTLSRRSGIHSEKPAAHRATRFGGSKLTAPVMRAASSERACEL